MTVAETEKAVVAPAADTDKAVVAPVEADKQAPCDPHNKVRGCVGVSFLTVLVSLDWCPCLRLRASQTK